MTAGYKTPPDIIVAQAAEQMRGGLRPGGWLTAELVKQAVHRMRERLAYGIDSSPSKIATQAARSGLRIGSLCSHQNARRSFTVVPPPTPEKSHRYSKYRRGARHGPAFSRPVGGLAQPNPVGVTTWGPIIVNPCSARLPKLQSTTLNCDVVLNYTRGILRPPQTNVGPALSPRHQPSANRPLTPASQSSWV